MPRIGSTAGAPLNFDSSSTVAAPSTKMRPWWPSVAHVTSEPGPPERSVLVGGGLSGSISLLTDSNVLFIVSIANRRTTPLRIAMNSATTSNDRDDGRNPRRRNAVQLTDEELDQPPDQLADLDEHEQHDDRQDRGERVVVPFQAAAHPIKSRTWVCQRWNQMTMPMVPAMPTPTRISHAISRRLGLVSLDIMNCTNQTANTPTA